MSKFFEVVVTKIETVVVEVSDEDLEQYDNEEKAYEYAEWELSDTDLIDSWTIKEIPKDDLETHLRWANHKSLLEE